MISNEHVPTSRLRDRVSDLAIAGIPKGLIAEIIDIDHETLNKHYKRELNCAEPEAIERVAKCVVGQALAGDAKAQSLYMKTKGAKYGWVEKQVIETKSADETLELKKQIAELEDKYSRDY
jgi:hypothetical protein